MSYVKIMTIREKVGTLILLYITLFKIFYSIIFISKEIFKHDRMEKWYC